MCHPCKKGLRVDKIAFEINYFIHDRLDSCFTTENTPATNCLRQPRPVRLKVITRDPQDLSELGHHLKNGASLLIGEVW